MTNTLRNNQEPKKVSEKAKLNPPIFEVQLIDFTRKNIAITQSMVRCKGGRYL